MLNSFKGNLISLCLLAMGFCSAYGYSDRQEDRERVGEKLTARINHMTDGLNDLLDFLQEDKSGDMDPGPAIQSLRKNIKSLSELQGLIERFKMGKISSGFVFAEIAHTRLSQLDSRLRGREKAQKDPRYSQPSTYPHNFPFQENNYIAQLAIDMHDTSTDSLAELFPLLPMDQISSNTQKAIMMSKSLWPLFKRRLEDPITPIETFLGSFEMPEEDYVTQCAGF